MMVIGSVIVWMTSVHANTAHPASRSTTALFAATLGFTLGTAFALASR